MQETSRGAALRATPPSERAEQREATDALERESADRTVRRHDQARHAGGVGTRETSTTSGSSRTRVAIATATVTAHPARAPTTTRPGDRARPPEAGGTLSSRP